MRSAAAILPLLFALACGGGNDVTGPTQAAPPRPTFPAVAGNYTGNITIGYPERGQTFSCPSSTIVTQNGSSINVAPLQLSGTCASAGLTSLPLGSDFIDNNGSLGGASGTLSLPCGFYNYTASGGFFGRQLQMSLVYVSRTCFNMNVTINLSR
jgi:hypothetical protein